ncbi:MAG: hypothetical protein KatS3mg042_1804 [Rhodothermaceae bacterium]|nr:MAG: hypothetical protein KatS3mg042_1804 [Rhodothermaceae bacterium]
MNQNIHTALYYAAIVSLGGFLFGFDASVISGVVGFVVRDFALNDWGQGLVVSAPALAAVVAVMTVGPLSDAFGRKKMLTVVAFLYTFSAGASALAPSFEVLVAARALGGLAFGSLILAPLYIAEMAPPAHRGRMVSMNQLNIVLGFSVAYFSNFLLLRVSTSGAAWVAMLGLDTHVWRWMLGLEIVPALLFFGALFLIPESPRWLVMTGRLEEARRVLARVAPPERVEQVLAEVQASVARSREQAGTRVRELWHPALRLPLLVALVVAITQQVTGVNAVYFYAPSIFEQSGVGTDAAFAQAIWVGLINVVFTVVAMVLIDRVGRKPLLVGGLAGVLVSMGVVAYGFHRATYELTPEAAASLPETVETVRLEPLIGVVYPNDVAYKQALRQALGERAMKDHEAALIQAAIRINPYVVLAGILGFVASFAVSLGPVMWVLLSEIFPNRVRGLAISVITFFNSLVSFGVQFVFPWELAHLGSAGTFLLYGLFAGVGLVLVIWLLPETKNRSLEELERFFAARAEGVSDTSPI